MMEDESLRRRAELARPDVSADEARTILQEHYDLSGDLIELGSQQDRNYRIDTGERRFVLKIARAEYARVELEAQNAALRHVGAEAGAPMVPQVVPELRRQLVPGVLVRPQPGLAAQRRPRRGVHQVQLPVEDLQRVPHHPRDVA